MVVSNKVTQLLIVFAMNSVCCHVYIVCNLFLMIQVIQQGVEESHLYCFCLETLMRFGEFSPLVNPNFIVIKDYHIDDLSMHHFELCLRGSFILQRKPTAFWCQCYSLWL